MSVPDTKARILDAAERLFSAEGVGRTSLRAITLAAGVNVAAVHYHFGSKETLLEAVFARRVAPVNAERLARLEQLEAGAGEEGPPLEAVLEAFVAPTFRLRQVCDGGPTLSQLLGRFYSEPDDVVERLLRDQFGAPGRRFLEALCRALPGVPPAEVAWRFQFLVALLGHVLSGRHRLDVIPGFRPEEADEASSVRRIVAFAAAGFRAPVGEAP